MSMVTAGIITGGLNILGGIFGASAASKRAKAAAREKAALTRKLEYLENNRQEITNPYANAENLSGMIQNPFESLGVATQAAEMQAEQADIALANTLDAVRSTGASAGGATALAQAALESKKGISASIEAQEAHNEKLRASGEQQAQQLKMQENIRMQSLDAAGKQFVFGQQEAREMQQLDRVSNQLAGSEARQMQAQADRTGAIMGAVGGVTSVVGNMYSAGAFQGKGNPVANTFLSGGGSGLKMRCVQNVIQD
jgi:hypothetical protein